MDITPYVKIPIMVLLLNALKIIFFITQLNTNFNGIENTGIFPSILKSYDNFVVADAINNSLSTKFTPNYSGAMPFFVGDFSTHNIECNHSTQYYQSQPSINCTIETLISNHW